MPQPLPTLRSFFDDLLPRLPPSDPQNISPISGDQSLSPSLNPTIKPLFLTLHVLFPNELLPALDLLDRKLVTRLHLIPQNPSPSNHKSAPPTSVYYVRTSQQARSGRFRSGRHGSASAVREDVSYEVRLQSWNCTCAAFAFGAFAGEGEDEGLDFRRAGIGLLRRGR